MSAGGALLTLAFLGVYLVGVWTILDWVWARMKTWSDAYFLRRYGVPADEIEQWEDETYGYDGR